MKETIAAFCLASLTSDETFNLHAIITANIMMIVIKCMREKTRVLYVYRGLCEIEVSLVKEALLVSRE